MNTLLAQGSVFFKDSKKTLIFSSLVVFTLVLEEIFETVVFQCPCENHLTYGLLFLLGPTFILLVAGIFLNPNTWWLCSAHKIKHQHKDVDQNCPCKKGKQRFCRTVVLFMDIFFKALISPIIWLVLSFLQKTFFVCAAFGPRLKNRNDESIVTNKTDLGCGNLKPRSLSEEVELMAKSQTIGLTLLITTTFIVICAFIGKCFCYRSKVSLPNEKFYMRVEAMEAAKEFNKRAKQEAQKQGKKAVEEAFEEMADNYKDNYLALIAKAAEKLDEKYSAYYNSSARIIEGNCKRAEEENKRGKGYVTHCRFEEDFNKNTFLMVDGKINTPGCETEIRATFESDDKEGKRTHTQSGITRVSLYRRAKSVK